MFESFSEGPRDYIILLNIIPVTRHYCDTPILIVDIVEKVSMASAASSIIFDDIFTINAIDKEGKKFDRGLTCLLCPPGPSLTLLS